MVNIAYNLEAFIVYSDKSRSETTLKYMKWKTTEDCNSDELYLNTNGNDMNKWGCKICPTGASCKNKKTEKDLYAKFGMYT